MKPIEENLVGASKDESRRNIPALKEIVEDRKEKAIESLSTSYAKDRLPLEEYERLVEYINKIESERELAVVEKIVAEYGDKGKPAIHDDEDDYDPPNTTRQYNQAANLAVLSSRTISGPVKSGAQFVSILGSEQIKVRKADLSKRRTDLNLVSILGDITIYVESGIQVSNKAIPILGSADVDYRVERMANEEAPELVISGASLLGSISVKLLKE
jgi:hypothetical protein